VSSVTTPEERLAEYTGNNRCGRKSPSIDQHGTAGETPTIDERRQPPRRQLFAELFVAVDLKTGKRTPVRHHPLTRHVLGAAAVDTTIDGKPRAVVAVPSKQGWLYCFDRVTGQPIWPIEERPVPQSTMKYEETAKTQPFPTKPAPYARTYLAESDLIDFTPRCARRP
jgi:glucose dehydrogenase